MRLPPLAYPTDRPPAPPYALRGAGAYFHLLDLAWENLLAGTRVAVRTDDAKGLDEFRSDLLDRARQYADLNGTGLAAIPPPPPAVFGPYDFSRTLGFHLAARRHPDAALLSPALSTEGYAFTPEEFVELKARLLQTLRHYERMPQVSGALNDLHTGHFRHGNAADAKAFVVRHAQDFLHRAESLHRRYLPALHGHARRQYFQRRAALNERYRAWIRLDADARRLGGENAGRKALREWRARWTDYHDAHYPTPYSPTDPPTPPADLTLTEGDRLRAAFADVERETDKAQLRLSPVTADSPDEAARLTELETALRDLLRDLDESGLYQLPLGGTEARTTVRQSQQLQNLLTRLRHTHRHLHEFDAFYARRSFWYGQPANLRRLMGPLLELPNADWEAAFTCWYFESCLRRAADAALLPTLSHPNPLVDPGDAENLAATLQIYVPGEDYDLILDVRPPSDGETGRPAGPVVHLTSIDDPAGVPVSQAGTLNPGLVFTQPFHATRAPRWRTAPISELRPSGERPVPTTLHWRAGQDAAPWQPLSELMTAHPTDIDLLLPYPLSETDRTQLLDNWTTMFRRDIVLRIYHAWPGASITEALLSDGFNANFLAAALIRACEAAADPDYAAEGLTAIGEEVRTRLGIPTPAPSPLPPELARNFERPPGQAPDGPAARFAHAHLPWRDTFLPLVLTTPEGRKEIYLPDNRLPGYDGHLSQLLRRRELEKLGFQLKEIRSADVWERGAEGL